MNWKKAFTVVEVMLVVTIISVLSVVTISFISLSRDRAKEAKVQQEKVLVKGVIEAYAAEHGGYPNPSTGGPKLYCIGGTNCAVKGRSVSNYIDPQTGSTAVVGFQLGDLISFTDESGLLSQGFVYASCGTADAYCTAENSGLLYPQSDDVLSSYFDGGGDDSLFSFLGGTTLDDFLVQHNDEYPIIDGDNDGYDYSCVHSDYSNYPNLFFYAFSNGICLAPTIDGNPKSYCSQTCGQIISSTNYCKTVDYPAMEGAFGLSGCYNNGTDGYYCTDTCENIVSQFTNRCTYDNGSGCFQSNDGFLYCRNSASPCNGGGGGGGGGGNGGGITDSDMDGVADDIDNCNGSANPQQEDMDNDAFGNVCDDDTDGDGILNYNDTDIDNDGLLNDEDPDQYNP